MNHIRRKITYEDPSLLVPLYQQNAELHKWSGVCTCLLIIVSCIVFYIIPLQKTYAQEVPKINTEGRWLYPLAASDKAFVAIERPFDKPLKNWLPGHRGVDFKTSKDLKIISPTEGTVSFSGKAFGRGVVTITDRQGYKISFEPIERKVKKEQKVQQGQLLGLVEDATEASHCKPAMCIHWGVRNQDNDYQNPLFFLHSKEPSILLPHL